jgi:iron complex outermembrane recepter protein
MTKTQLFIVLLGLQLNSFSQNSVKGQVIDSTKVAVPYCAMALLNSSDSSLVKGNLSDSSGFYLFEKIKAGNYFIKFNTVGYQSSSTAYFRVDSLTQLSLPPQVLTRAGVNLGEVSIAVYKPAIEFKNGMVIMNVENDLLAKGNTVLELLKRIPGVIVDAQNNISINGTGGARFLIDDRLQQMPVPQVIDMLSSMSADAISKIELMKNPPARYDAAGTGGLINIVTKRANVKGYNGSLVFGASQGKRARFGPFASFNYKSNKLSVFTSLNYGHWDGLNVVDNNRTLSRNGSMQTIDAHGNYESFQKVLFYNGGLEYDLTPKTILGLYVNGNSNEDVYNTSMETNIRNGNDFNYSKLLFTVNDSYIIQAPSYNLSLLQKIDSTGGQIKLSVGYNNYLEKQKKLSENHFYDINDQEVALASNYNTTNDRDFKVFTQKIDLNKTFKNKLALESGLKSSFVNNYSITELKFSNQSTGLFLGDTTFYNNYRYKESIMAAYTTVSRSWEKLGFSLGLRAENTDIQANDLKTGYAFKRTYFNVFPSGSLDLTLNKKNTISTAYSFRIDRPHYGMLNPVRIFNEQMGYNVGNSELRPQYTHNITVDYNYNQFITQSIGINNTRDFTFYYAYTPVNSKVLIDTIYNVPQRNESYYSISAQKRIKWYSFQTYGVIMYRTLVSKILGEDISSKTVQVYFNLNQEFYLPKEFKIQVWAGYGTPFKDGLQYYSERSAIHLSFSKTFFEKKLTVTLSLQDVLYTDYTWLKSTLSDQSQYYQDKYDTRRARINVNYRFGKMRIDQRLKVEDDLRLKSGK